MPLCIHSFYFNSGEKVSTSLGQINKNQSQSRQQSAAHQREENAGHIHKIHNANDTMYSDQKGRFPAMSSRENQYIMVFVKVDGNYIDTVPKLTRHHGMESLRQAASNPPLTS
jgi:hypothetical protein